MEEEGRGESLRGVRTDAGGGPGGAGGAEVLTAREGTPGPGGGGGMSAGTSFSCALPSPGPLLPARR